MRSVIDTLRVEISEVGRDIENILFREVGYGCIHEGAHAARSVAILKLVELADNVERRNTGELRHVAQARQPFTVADEARRSSCRQLPS